MVLIISLQILMSVWSTMNVILWQAVKTPMGASFASVRLVLQEMEQAAQVNMTNKTMQHYYLQCVVCMFHSNRY